MIKVVWYVQGEDEEQFTSHVPTATDFLQSLDLVDVITLEAEEYKVIDKELVVDEEPYITILLEG
jgi:hypothetical protein